MAAPTPLRLLLLEDSPDDAELLAMELERSGIACEITRTETLQAFERALDTGAWDAIISDFKLIGFTAKEALQAYGKRGIDAPFIVVSGEVGEETAVMLMKAGAHDFFLKDNLVRLAPAIQREIREAATRVAHREALARLRESEERFRTLADAAPVMIWATDNTCVRNYFNRPWLEFRGRTLEQEAAEGWREGIHREDAPRLREALDAKLAAHAAYRVEFRLRRRDGDYRWIMESATPRFETGKGFIGYIGSSVDVTPLKQSERSLEIAVKARDEFLSAASHELRTPLTALSLQLSLLQTKLAARADAAEAAEAAEVARGVDKAARQVVRLENLVNTMLDLARITAGGLKLNPVRLDLARMVTEVADDLHDAVARSGSQLTVRAEEPVVGSWDPVHLTTVISNLIDNAVKYGRGKPIDIAVTRHEGVARLTVTDHGIGIAPESQERIFGRFERGVAERIFSGLGIGLWIARQVVESHGGTIHVTSAPGQGATFEVELPMIAKTERGEPA